MIPRMMKRNQMRVDFLPLTVPVRIHQIPVDAQSRWL